MFLFVGETFVVCFLVVKELSSFIRIELRKFIRQYAGIVSIIPGFHDFQH